MIETQTELFPPPIPQGPPLDGPVLLKDGRPAYLRPSSADDLDRADEGCSSAARRARPALPFLRRASRRGKAGTPPPRA